MRILLTGSTGYIGGRLAPELLNQGHELVCPVRTPRKLDDRPWSSDDRVTIVQADIADTETLHNAAKDCDAAYYLIHAMEAGSKDFIKRDRQLAQSFADATKDTNIKQIIYLGGLGELGEGLSDHLKSRREVEQVLRSADAPLTALRAAIILGSGSASFEILRYLVERLPAMITPKWVKTRCQPISIVDVLAYLTAVLNNQAAFNKPLDIGGPRVLTYLELMREMTEALELPRRIVLPLPVLTPKLSSLWIGLVTPVSPAIARPLAEGLKNEVIVRNNDIQSIAPRDTIDPREAIERALRKTRSADIITRWSAAGPVPGDPDWAGGKVFKDERTITIEATPEATYAAVCRIGGGNGWYAADILWQIRGWMDQFIGGPGLRRGRRHPELVEYGESLDFWRVTDLRRNKRLELRAEMKLPGTAELAFDINPSEPENQTQPPTQTLRMTARFRPKGLLGLAYWYAVLPAHHIVFNGMLNGIKRTAEQSQPHPMP